MKNFELWVDESGSFSEDNLLLEGMMPSHVAGILYDTSFPIEPIIACAPEDNYHSTEQNDANELYENFRKIAKQNIQFVLFQNSERLLLVDDKITYLNVMTEGIVQLLKRLKNIYGDFKLTILIARRTDNPQIEEDEEKYGAQGYISIIKKNEYVKRLSEKLLLLGKRERILENSWDIVLGSAKKDKKLLMCDIVSNVFFTKDTKIKRKCGVDAATCVNEIYNSERRTWRFSVIEDPISADFFYLMSEAKLGEAVSLLCQEKDAEKISNRMQMVRRQLSEMTGKEIELQYRTISNLIQYYLTQSRDYQKCLFLLKNLEEFFVPVLKEVEAERSDCFSTQLSFDIWFCMDTVYDHLGDVCNSIICEEKCDRILRELPKDWDFIMYYMKYQLRKINTQINLFDYENAERNCSILIEQNKNFKEAIELAEDANVYNVKFPELAKALNTRLSIRTFMIREKTQIYDMSLQDFYGALEEFHDPQDKKRVYSNALKLETEKGNAERALVVLYKMFDIANKPIENKLSEDFITIIKDRISNEYDYMSYVRLMSEGIIKDFYYSKQMFEALKKCNATLTRYMDQQTGHPYEIIYWKYATYLMKVDNYKEALKYYEKALNICFNAGMPTLICIGMGIEFERYSFALKHNDPNCHKYYRLIVKHYRKLQDEAFPEILRELFGYLPIQENLKNQAELFWDLSRKITY